MKAQGGVGAPTPITDPNTGQVQAGQLDGAGANTVLLPVHRRTRSTYILTYGRPFSPMPAWGVAGGGPMNDQQISDLVAYLQSIQIPMEGCAPGEITCDDGHLPTGDPEQPRR